MSPQSHHFLSRLAPGDNSAGIFNTLLKDIERQAPDKFFAIRFCDDGDEFLLIDEIDNIADVCCNSHKHPLLIKQDAAQHPAPHASLIAEGESEWCNIFTDKIKLNEPFIVDSRGFRESPLRHRSVV